MNSATRVLISTFGGLVGLIGVEHGLGEILQGSAAPDGLLILSWPHSDFFSVLGGEPALTVIPNLLVTGILAVCFSLLYFAWAVWFIQSKRGGWVLILLTIPKLLCGGGIFPPLLGVLIGAAATRIHAPRDRWRKLLSPGFRHLLDRSWPWLYGACLLSWLSMFPGLALLSYFFGVEKNALILLILAGMFGFLFLAGIAGFVRDSLRQAEPAAGDG